MEFTLAALDGRELTSEERKELVKSFCSPRKSENKAWMEAGAVDYDAGKYHGLTCPVYYHLGSRVVLAPSSANLPEAVLRFCEPKWAVLARPCSGERRWRLIGFYDKIERDTGLPRPRFDPPRWTQGGGVKEEYFYERHNGWYYRAVRVAFNTEWVQLSSVEECNHLMDYLGHH